VGHAVAAADADDPADDAVSLHLRDEAEVVGENVDRVVGRVGEADLELPRQVGRAVERLVLSRGAVVLAGDEDRMVRAGARQQRGGEHARALLEHRVDGVAHRRGGGHDVPRDVAAGGEGGQQRLVDRGDGSAQVALGDAVELDGLARGDAQGAVAVAVSQMVEREILRRRQSAGGDAHAHYELPVLLEAGLLQGGGGVAVVLLVGAVELEEGIGRLRHLGRGLVGQLRGDGAPETPALRLDPLDARTRHAAPRC
jgi:hypothetical protein